MYKLLLIPLLIVCKGYAQEPTYYGGEAGKKLDWTFFYLHNHYVDSTDIDRLAEKAILGIFKELDPYSKYQSKEQLEEQRKRDEGIKNDGLGLQYYIIRDTATVTYIETGSPAQYADIRRGDKILAVDGINTISGNHKAIKSRLDAAAGITVHFNLLRNGEEQSIDVTSTKLFATSIDATYLLDATIGYIKLNRFTSKTVGEVREALQRLERKGAKHLVLDLRKNRGGVVKGATGLVDEFLSEDKLIMSSKGQGYAPEEYFTTADGRFKKGKLVILVDKRTASASEIVTGALQEWNRALIIGEMTFGKGLIQQSYLLNDSAAVRLTIGRYYTPTGRTLQRPFQFDSSKDWVFKNIANAVHHGDFTAPLAAPDSVRWQTKSGRMILKGQGSIIPDIYLPQRKSQTPLLEKLNRLGLVYKFTVYHADKYRFMYLQRFKDGNAFRLDSSIDELIITDFYDFLLKNIENQDFAQSITNTPLPQSVLTQIKAWLGPQLWENGTYYAVFNNEDEAVLRAIRCIKDDTFDRLGVFY